jgi:hypothetical protein
MWEEELLMFCSGVGKCSTNDGEALEGFIEKSAELVCCVKQRGKQQGRAGEVTSFHSTMAVQQPAANSLLGAD